MSGNNTPYLKKRQKLLQKHIKSFSTAKTRFFHSDFLLTPDMYVISTPSDVDSGCHKAAALSHKGSFTLLSKSACD